MNATDYYQLLGVSPGASPVAIRSAYRRRALQAHPDRNGESPRSVERMMALNAAYAVLSDPQRRRAYDAQLRRTPQPAAAGALADAVREHGATRRFIDKVARRCGLQPFGEIVRAGGGGRPPAGAETGAIATAQLVPSRSLPQRALGAVGRLARRLFDPADCAAGHRTGCLQLTPWQAQHGGEIEYAPHRLTGHRLRIRIPAGLRHGQSLRLPGMGRPTRYGTAPGDLYLTVHIRAATHDSRR